MIVSSGRFGQNLVKVAQVAVRVCRGESNEKGSKAADNAKLLERAYPFYQTRLQQITLHLSALHQENTPTPVAPATRPILEGIVALRKSKPRQLNRICSYVGPNQQRYSENDWTTVQAQPVAVKPRLPPFAETAENTSGIDRWRKRKCAAGYLAGTSNYSEIYHRLQ